MLSLLLLSFFSYSKEFAYSSSDKMVYIRKFSTVGSKMTLVNTLQGHDAEVTCVKWNSITNKWVTGSEDATIRIWVRLVLSEQFFNKNYIHTFEQDLNKVEINLWLWNYKYMFVCLICGLVFQSTAVVMSGCCLHFKGHLPSIRMS